MRRPRLAPLLLLLVAAVLTALWLGSRSDDGGGSGGELARPAEQADAAHPVLRGRPDAEGRPTTEALDPDVVLGTPGPVSGVVDRPPKGHSWPNRKQEKPFRITGTTRDPATGDVQLRVTDERGNPRADIRICVSAKGEDGKFSVTHEAVTDATGEKALEGVRPGTAYVRLYAGRGLHRIPVDVEAGRITEVDARVPIGVVVEGRVRHVEKGPLADIRVEVDLGLYGKHGSFQDTTDAEGRYRLEGVPVGTHPASFVGRAIGYHPRPKASLVIEEETGVVQHDFVLGVVAIRGAVRDAATGRPLPEVRVEVGGLFAETTTDAAGLYALEDIPPDTYRLYFTKNGYTTGRSGEVPVVLARPATLDMELAPAAAVVFVLRTPEGEPVPGVGRVRYRVVKGASGVSGSARITADETGTAHYDRIDPGTYEFSFALDAHTAEERQVDVGAGETRIDVICAPDASDEPVALRGVIRDATTREPVGGVKVSPHQSSRNPAISTARGEYAFRSLTPGGHQFWISKDGYGIFLLRGVVVKAGETAVHDLDLQPAGTLHLHLTDARGDPVVGGVSLSIHPQEGTEGTRLGTGATADANGYVTYRRIVPGTYRIAVRAPSVGQGTAEVDVGTGESTVYVRLE